MAVIKGSDGIMIHISERLQTVVNCLLNNATPRSCYSVKIGNCIKVSDTSGDAIDYGIRILNIILPGKIKQIGLRNITCFTANAQSSG